MATHNVVHANDQNFEAEVLQSSVPVLVDFTATWCGPCKMLSPIVDKLADEFVGVYKVVKVDIDEAEQTARKFGIRSVPTVMVFKAGQKTAQNIGVTQRDKLVAMLQG
jgi:thioredoxin 1